MEHMRINRRWRLGVQCPHFGFDEGLILSDRYEKGDVWGIRSQIQRWISRNAPIYTEDGLGINQSNYQVVKVVKSDVHLQVCTRNELALETAELVRKCFLRGTHLTLLWWDQRLKDYFEEEIL